MNNIINIVFNDKREIVVDSKTYIVNDSLKEVAKKLLRIYEIMIAVFVVIGVNVAPMMGSSSFFSDILFIIILLAILTTIFNYIAKAIFKRMVN